MGQRWQALALLAQTSFGTGLTWWGRLIQRGIQPQAGDANQTLARQGRQQVKRGKTAVTDKHNHPFWQPRSRARSPAPRLQAYLTGPVRQLLVALVMRAAEAFGGCQHSQKRQPSSGIPTAARPESWSASPQTRCAQGTGASSIRLSQRRPLVLTTNDFDERIGSR